jgi:DNA-directed RNA polymerase specialized sigma24 family protein
MSAYFVSPAEVVRGLVTYTDWWQPSSASVLQVGGARRSSSYGDGAIVGLLEHVDERSELRRRMLVLQEQDRHLLYLWYVVQQPAATIAQTLGISRRQCFRRLASAIRRIVEAGEAAA